MSEAEVRYKFIASGQESVREAFRGIGKAAEEAARSQARLGAEAQRASRAGGGGGGGGAGGAGRRASETERLALRVAAAQERAEAKRVKATDAASKRIWATYQREGQQRMALAEKVARAEATTAAKAAAAQSRAWQASASGAISGVARWGGGAMVAGGALLAKVGSDAFKTDEIARRIAANQQLSGGGRGDIRSIRKSFSDAARAAPGQTAEDVGKAALSFQGATGQVADADQLKAFTTIASGAGAAIDDVAQAAAALSNNLNIKDVDDMAEALAGLAVQGAKGQFELKDAAALMGKVSAAAAGANWDKSVSGVKSLGGLLQVARKGGGGREDSVTAVENVMRNMASAAHQSTFKAEGVSTFKAGTNNRELRNVNDVLVESFVKTKGDKTKLGKMYGAQADPVINSLSAVFSDAMKKGGNAKQAGEAVRKALEDAAVATNAYKSVQDAAATAQESASAKLSKVWEDIVGEAGDKLVPAFASLVTTLEQAGAFETLVDSVTVLADAFKATAETLQDLGLISKKTPDLNKQYKDADAIAARAEGRAGKFTASKQDEIHRLMGSKKPGDIGKGMALMTEFFELQGSAGAARTKANAAKNALFQAPTKFAGQADFEAQYLAAGGNAFDASATGRVMGSGRMDNRWAQGDKALDNESEEARRIRSDFISQQVLDKGRADAAFKKGGGTEDGLASAVRSGDVAAYMMQVAEAAKQASANLNKVTAANQPSIGVGG